MGKRKPDSADWDRTVRAWLGLLLLAGVVLYLLVLPQAGVDLWLPRPHKSDGASAERGRQEGLREAEIDLARGTPYLRRGLDTYADLPLNGVGVDRTTGLPLDNTALECGTGVDGVAYAAENEAYSERILEAYERGDLKDLSLAYKIRTASAVRALFADAEPRRLERDEDRVEACGGKFVLTYRDWDAVTLARSGSRPRALRLIAVGMGAHGPFDVLIVDDGTTAILRDKDGFAWIVDLPRGIVVQVLDTKP